MTENEINAFYRAEARKASMPTVDFDTFMMELEWSALTGVQA